MSSSQVGKTEFELNVAGYYMHQDPSPILFLMPTLVLAEAFSKDRLAPMLRDTPMLAQLVADPRSRDSSNTLLHKQFPGGHITMAGANSAASLASRPIRIVLADEVDKYEASAGTEGDPLSLAERRTVTFWNRKLIMVSTPGVKELSRIEPAYLESDQRHYFLPCAHCSEMQVPMWANVHWPEGDPAQASLYCVHCGARWSEPERLKAILNGEWRAAAEFHGRAGFHLNQLSSPWSSPAEMALEFVRVKKFPERLKVWVNSSLGESWEATHDVQEPDVLRARAEEYALGTVPLGALLVVGSVDVQGDRLESYTWGYGEGEEAWVLDFAVFHGDPAHPVVWEQLLEHIRRPLDHELGGQCVARTVAIDSGGLHTQEVYAFCRLHAMTRTSYGLQQIIAIKGASERGKSVIGTPTAQDINLRGDKIRGGVKLWPVGSHGIKQTIYGRLAIEAPGPGYIHTSKQLPEDFYDQLISERLTTKYSRGFPILEWTLPKGRRNEALDCAVYAYAAAYQLGLPRMKADEWRKRRARLTKERPAQSEAQPDEESPPPPPKAPPPGPPPQGWSSPRGGAFGPPRAGGNWMKGWRR